MKKLGIKKEYIPLRGDALKHHPINNADAYSIIELLPLLLKSTSATSLGFDNIAS